MNTYAFVQARTGSVRFPNKLLKKVNGKSIFEILLKRLSRSKEINKIIVVAPKSDRKSELKNIVRKNKQKIFYGSENDLLDRYYKAAKYYNASTVVRITGDCPLVDPKIVDEVIQKFKKKKVDFACNNEVMPYADGLDVEVSTFSALEDAWKKAKKISDREDVMPYVSRAVKNKKYILKSKIDCSNIRLTLDYQEDFEVILKIFDYFKPNIYFSFLEIYKFYKKNPEVFRINNNFVRDEGSNLSYSQKLWSKAKRIIPGGNMLLSKRPEIFLPDKWPNYFSKSKGCYVWGLDKKRYIDMSIMSVGTNILGYGNPQVDKSVKNTIQKGNMSSLNCPEEVKLAERLIELHPWADMVKFARTGGEANAIAIRIARAASGRDKIAICGYHGWHDWYLAANIRSKKNLNEHLISGLNPYGVPKALKNTVLPFSYNNFKQLENLVKNNRDIGSIKMEVARNFRPKNNFLQKVVNLCKKNKIVLIFDECTSGFRETFGGLHKKYNVEPDIAIFGKALGNGYAITSIIGKRDVMQSAQTSFISSTFWTERIGPTAALETLKVMEKTESWKKISKIGKIIKNGWKSLAKKHNLKISVNGLDPIPNFSFDHTDDQYYQTYLTQEMLKRGFLSISNIFICVSHKKEILVKYFNNLDPIFKKIKECQSDRRNIKSLIGKLPYTGFERLN